MTDISRRHFGKINVTVVKIENAWGFAGKSNQPSLIEVGFLQRGFKIFPPLKLPPL